MYVFDTVIIFFVIGMGFFGVVFRWLGVGVLGVGLGFMGWGCLGFIIDNIMSDHSLDQKARNALN